MADAGYLVRGLVAEECAAIAGWQYDEPLANYGMNGAVPDPADGYFAVEDGTGAFVGYCCFGAEARVPGVEAEDGVLDVGVGLAPEHVGRGHSGPYVEAVIAFGIDAYEPTRLRVAVLDWNGRSLVVCRRAGFVPVGEVTTGNGRFVVLERPA